MQLPAHIESVFFKPVQFSLLESLISRYDAQLKALRDTEKFLSKPEYTQAVHHFVECSVGDNRYMDLTGFLDMKKAEAKLDADFWQNAMNETDIMQHMPQARKSEWNEMIRERNTPKFNVENVKSTFQGLLIERPKFMAEKVDGFFKTLSGQHVTNSKTGFTKRMIINGFLDKFGYTNNEKSGCLFDLRDVMRKISGRDITLVDCSTLIHQQRSLTGEWVVWDGGMLRVKIFKKGTLHIEIHPDIAWQLNTILAFLYPTALSSGSTKPPKKEHDFGEIIDTVPNTVRENLSKCRVNDNEGEFLVAGCTKESVPFLESIGGVFEFRELPSPWDGMPRRTGVVVYDFDPSDAVRHIIITGMFPNKKSHQFIPTPQVLGDQLIYEMFNPAQMTKDTNLLEPSAGVGHLADLCGDATVHCYEISELRQTVLKSKGYTVLGDDFLKAKQVRDYEYIVMNPPFANNRAKLHVEHALGFLVKGGVLGAILPATLSGHDWGDEYSDVWYSDVLSGQFPDASVNVVLCVIRT